HSVQTPFNEKEIRFPISILQTSPPIRRFTLLRGDHARSVCAATHSLRPIGQFTAHCARPISWRYAGSEVRYLAADAQHETAACESRYEIRERRGGADSARTSRSSCARYSCPASARQ